MDKLRVSFEALGFEQVKTYIQSGNVVFKAKKTSTSVLSTKIEEKILSDFGFSVSVISRSSDEMAQTIARNPFLKQSGIDQEKLHVTFLSEAPAPAALKKLVDLTAAPDQCSSVDREIYFYLPNGVSQSVLMKSPVDRSLAVVTTTRNWRTVNSLHQICRDFRLMRQASPLIAALALALSLLSCSSKPDPNTLVMIIESSPTNLDPRVGQDAQSQRIYNLIFDDLLSRGDNLDVAPGLAERWEIPDPLTYIFHLHQGVKFHDGRPLTSRDVKWTFDSLLQGKVRSTKTAAYRFVDHIDAPDDFTVTFHMKEPDAALLWNISDGAIGIVPYGSGNELTRSPSARDRSSSSAPRPTRK